MIHYEPQPRTHLRIAVPLKDPSGSVSDHFGESPCFVLVTLRLSDGQVETQDVIANPYRDVETAKGIRVAEWLVQQKVDRVFMREDLSHKGPGYVLGQAGIITEKTAASLLAKVLADFRVHRPEDSAITEGA